MATRATYEINRTTFYCHWDGYPTGAAQRFANMVAQLTVANKSDSRLDAIEDRRGGLEFAFIRGNMDAEPTNSRDGHGDTEWHYKVEANKIGEISIKVETRTWSDDNRDRWRLNYCGDLADWLNARRTELVARLEDMKSRNPGQYGDLNPQAEALECIPVIVRKVETRDAFCGGSEYVTYATLEQATTILAGELRQVEWFSVSCAAHGQPFAVNPNKVAHEKKAHAWSVAIFEADQPAASKRVEPTITEPTAPKPAEPAATGLPDQSTKIVRAFSTCGPCLTLGRLTHETDQFYCYEEWRGGDLYEGKKRVRKRTSSRYSRAHVEPCSSCRDHPKTQYPNGYMD